MRHTLPRTLAISLVLLGLAASGGAGDEGEAPAATDADHDTGLTGALSEEAFAQLHTLSAAETPPPRGTMIELDGERAYLSLPEDAAPPLPGIVVIHEWWGLNDHIMHWTDRLAAAGYAALAVDLYGGTVATTREAAMAAMQAVDEERALEILAAAHAFLADDARIRAERRASIGWCFGGGWSLQQALHAPDLDAAVIYYGRLTTDPEALQAIEASLLGIFANRDSSIPPEVVDAFEAALEEADVEHTILRYDADHAFANPSSARYDQEAATDAWAHVADFLARELR
ncbi:MAG: dienelactone hydrolase family protein [Candidatus Eiseniibacteriota bacterium]|jgi:carboxymethylenebutenolidase